MPLRIEEALSSLSFSEELPIDLSPDGEWVAYTLEDFHKKEKADDERYSFFTRTGNRMLRIGCDVWVTHIVSGKSMGLTKGEGNSWGPVWSPDVSSLAFYSDRSGQAGLWVWEKVSDTLQPVSDAIVRPFYGDEVVRWTPDSRKTLCKVLPEGMTLEESLSLIMGPRKVNNKKEGAQSSVLVYRSSQAIGCKNGVKEHIEVDITNLYLSDLALIDVSTGQVERIVRRLKILGYWLSPNGSNVALVTLKDDVNDIVVASLSDGHVRVVAPNLQPSRKFALSWSPDGRLISYTVGGDCFVVNVAEGKPRKLTDGAHPNFDHVYRPPLWDATGQNLYFIASDTLWRVTVPDGTTVAVTRIPNRQLLEIASPAGTGRFWSPDDGKSLYLITRDDETKRCGFYKVDLTSGESVQLSEENISWGSRAIFTIDVSDDGKHVIYTKQDAQHCENVWIAGIDFQNPRQLTRINPIFEDIALGASRLIEWKSIDGQRLRGALLLPSEYETGKRYPLIVWVYGGDWGSNRVNRFGLEGPGVNNLQLLATRGYTVLFPDAPLQGKTPMQALMKTVLPGVNKAIEIEIADPDRIGVMGHSYGGYSILALIVQTTRFKAAVSSAGYGNLLSYYGFMRRDGSTYGMHGSEGRFGGTPWQFRHEYIENSPAFYLDRVQTPLLLTHGSLDNAVPSFLADEIFVGLHRLEKEVVYVKYEGETHAPADWTFSNQVDFWKRVIAWLDEHLKPPR